MPKKPFPVPRPSTAAASLLPLVKLSPRGAARVKAGHPWVYRSDLASPDANAAPAASLVHVADPRGKILGSALYSSSSQIAIRILSRNDAVIADLAALIADRIRAAIAYRRQMVSGSNACRLVFSEADFLPGLIIDRYNDVFSVQILTQAMDTEPVRGAIIETLVADFSGEKQRDDGQPIAGILERVDSRIRELEQLPPRESGLMWGKKSSTVITMNTAMTMPASAKGDTGSAAGLRFHYDGLEGQKTGAFLDQRENYAAAARYAHGDALDVFCYQGGFALHLAQKCASVTGIDSSRPALEMADKNAALNFPGRELEWIEANAFDVLRDYARAERKYGTIVLDPPAFAKTKRDLPKALAGYKELNLRALKMLQPGGTLVTCSCSFHVSSADFLEVVGAAAVDAHRTLRVLDNRGAAKDHPMLLNVPETSYLKCLILTAS